MSVAGETNVRSSPYKGLMPYAEEDAALFFGREAEKEIIAANLQAYRLTLLYGASGVGKSSVLRAGVAHHLRQLAAQAVTERGALEFVVVVFSSWRDDSVPHLIASIRDSVADALVGASPAISPPSGSLVETLAQWTSQIDCELLVILDQFEEYFLYHPQEDGEGTLAVELPRAISRPGLRANFLLSIREDSLAKLDRFKGRIPNLFDNYLRIDHLDRRAGREAIEKPIAHFNRLQTTTSSPITIEPPLIDAVLDQVRAGRVLLGDAGRGGIGTDVQTSPGQRIETPYLQLVMTRLWKEERGANSNVLRLETLNNLGGADRIVRTHLDDVMNALTPGERRAAARVFRYLVTPSGTKIAHTIADLADYAGLPQSQLEPIAEKLSSGDLRIIRPIAPSPDKPTVPRYEIFHDVLAPAILDWRQRADAERRALVERTLEPLHRRTWTLAWLFLANSLILTAPLTVAITDDPESPLWALPGWFLGTMPLIGLVSLVGTVVQLLGIWRRVAHAVALGFRWRTIADVMADRRGDIGALIARTWEFSNLDAISAGRIRALRRLEAALALSAAGIPLLGLLAVVMLGSRGLLGAAAASTLVVGPSAILLAVGLGVLVLETAVLHRSRRPASGQSSALVIERNSPPEWFEGVTPETLEQSSVVRVRLVGWLIGVTLAVLIASVTLVTVPLATVTLLAPLIWQTVTPYRERLDARIKLAQVGQPYRIPSDPAISPLAAGRAFYSIEQAGKASDRQPDEQPVTRPIDRVWIPDLENSPFGKEAAVCDTLLTRGAEGFTSEETEYLERIASNPGFAELSVVARASEMDYLGARLVPQHKFPGILLPVPHLLEVRSAGRALVAKAALQLSRGRPFEAEETVRETISFGFVAMSEGHSLIELLIGASVVESGLKSLEDFYSATGQETRASELRTRRQAATTTIEEVQERVPLEFRSAEMTNARRVFMGIARDRQRIRGDRWEALQILALAPCSNAKELTFGPSEEWNRTFDIARTSLVRFPSEQQLFENTRATVQLPFLDQGQQPNGLLPAIIPRMSRWSAWVFGNSRLRGCGSLLVLASAS